MQKAILQNFQNAVLNFLLYACLPWMMLHLQCQLTGISKLIALPLHYLHLASFPRQALLLDICVSLWDEIIHFKQTTTTNLNKLR